MKLETLLSCKGLSDHVIKKVHSATEDKLVSAFGENELRRKVITAGAISNWSVIEVRRFSSRPYSSVRSHRHLPPPIGYFSNKISVIKKENCLATSIILPLLTFLFPLPSVIAQKHLFRQMGLDLLEGCISLNTTSSYLRLKHFWLQTSVRVFSERFVPHSWPGTYWYTRLGLNRLMLVSHRWTLIKNVSEVDVYHHLHTRVSCWGVRTASEKLTVTGKVKKEWTRQLLVWWILPKSKCKVNVSLWVRLHYISQLKSHPSICQPPALASLFFYQEDWTLADHLFEWDTTPPTKLHFILTNSKCN